MTTSTEARPPGPTEPAARALGPDFARGFMLLFIALANTHYFLRAPAVLGGYPQNGSPADTAVVWLLSTFVDGRAFPLFGLLFGYGVARIAQRQESRGPRGVRRLLWRRSAVLIIVGLVDAVLFYVGDILGAYGVLLLLGAWLIRWKDRWLLVIAGVFLLLNSLPDTGATTVVAAQPSSAELPPDLGALFVDRPPVALFIAILGPLGFLCPFAIGLWAGRRRILEEPERHRRLLTGTAATGLGLAVLGAQPVALLLTGVLEIADREALGWAAALHGTTGTAGGFGYAALLALTAARLGARRTADRPTLPGRSRPAAVVVAAIAATGQRSMTAYLMQSVTWAVVFTPFLLDLSATLTVTTTAALAGTTWAGTVLAADRMRRAGRRGPFEVLIRRFTYGRRR